MEMRSEDPFEQEESSMRFLHRLELERDLKPKVMVLCIWCCHVIFHKVQTTPLKGIFPKTAKKAFMVLLSIPIAPWIWFSFPTLPSGCINPQNSGKWSTFSLLLTWIATTPNNLLFGYRETKQWFFFFFFYKWYQNPKAWPKSRSNQINRPKFSTMWNPEPSLKPASKLTVQEKLIIVPAIS